MKNPIIVPVILLVTTPFIVSCTKSVTQTPTPPAVTGITETIDMDTTVSPQETGVTEAIQNTVNPVDPKILSRVEVVSYDTRSPEGIVEIEFDVTVTDGIITAASAKSKTDTESTLYNQTNFVAALSGAVVGKKAANLEIDAIGGSSLTTAAFQQFISTF